MASRKLMSEIERTLKKIQEGIENFDEIWERVHAAKKPNVKEKFEADLKKEIKRLQRYRDSVKTWASQDVIKQKQPLLDARKEIELRMERVWRFFQYKRCERQGLQAGSQRDLNSKSYSHEGLGKGKLELLTPEQEESIDWIDKQEEALKTQLADLTQEQEKLNGGSRKKKKNRERDDEELTAVQKRIEQHEFHIKNMKMLKEVIIKSKVKPGVIESVREAVEYYVTDAIQDPQFMDDDYLYEPIHEAMENDDKEEDEEVEESPVPPPVPEKKVEKRTTKKNRKKEKKKRSVTPTTPSDKKRTSLRSSPNVSTTVSPIKSRVFSQEAGRISENIISFAGSKKPAHSPAPSSEHNAPSSSAGSRVSHKDKIKSSTSNSQPSLSQPAGSPEPAKSEATSVTSGAATIFRSPLASADIPHRETPPSLSLTQHSQTTQSSQPQTKRVPALADIIADELAKKQNHNTNASSIPRSGSESSHSKPPTPYLAGEGVRGVSKGQPTHVRSRQQRTLSKHDTMLHHSYQNMIQPCDTCRERTYLPRNPYQTPRFFPEHPDPLLYEPPIFEKFDTDTLFFIFYFQQGTYQQYLAACELKKGAWRYHKKYLTWFQRHQEPEETTEEYEKGTYVYFDYDTSWCPRMKTQFVFEYSYLEDELDYVNDEFHLKG